MKALKLAAATAALSLLAMGSAAQATVVTFDDIPDHYATGDSPIANPYAGFVWNNVYVSGTGVNSGGYATGVVSSSHDAYNGYNYLASFSKLGGGVFDFISLYVTGSSTDETVNFQGLLGGNVIFSASVSAVTSGPTFHAFNWSGVDTVTFGGGSSQAVLDDVTLNAGVPEPASWALMIGGFGLAGAALRRRRTAIAAV